MVIASSLSPAIISLASRNVLYSCAYAIFSLRSVVDYYVKCGSTINMRALDLTKAFDKMNHHGLFIKLMEKRIPSHASARDRTLVFHR